MKNLGGSAPASGTPISVLLNDVVEVFALAHRDINTGVSLNAFNGGCVDTAFFDGDLRWHAVQVDGMFQKSLHCGHIAFSSEKEIDRVTVTINGAEKVFPLTRHFDRPPMLIGALSH